MKRALFIKLAAGAAIAALNATADRLESAGCSDFFRRRSMSMRRTGSGAASAILAAFAGLAWAQSALAQERPGRDAYAGCFEGYRRCLAIGDAMRANGETQRAIVHEGACAARSNDCQRYVQDPEPGVIGFVAFPQQSAFVIVRNGRSELARRIR